MNAVKAPTVRGRLRRQVTSAMLVLSLSMGAIVATPTPTHAVGSYVLAQFSINGRFPVPSCFCGSDVAGATVKVMYSLDGRVWNFLGYGYYRLNEVGSFGFNAPGMEHWYFAMMVDEQIGSARFMSPWVIFYPYDRSPKKALVSVW